MWTFVLLGFLAQSSNGATEIRSSVITQELNSKLYEELKSLWGTSLTLISTDPSANFDVEDIASISVNSRYISGVTWSFRGAGLITIGSPIYPSVWYRFLVKRRMDLAAENGSPAFKMQSDKSAVSLNVQSSGLRSSRSITNTSMDIALLLKSKIEQACQSGIDDMNLEFQRIRYPVTYLGNTWRFHISYIQHLPDSVVFGEDVAIETDNGVKTYSLYIPSITSSELPAERSYETRVSDDFIMNIAELLEFYNQRNLTEAEFDGYKIFPEVPGEKKIQVKQPSPPVYKASESRVAYTPHTYIRDKTNNLLMEFETLLTQRMTFDNVKGSYRMSVNDPQISKTSAVFVDPKCVCDNDPVPHIQSLITSCITEAISKMQYQLKSPFPNPMPLSFLRGQPTCSNVKGMNICGA